MPLPKALLRLRQGYRPRPLGLPPVLQGVLWMVLATMCSASMNALIRYISAEVHPFQVALFRNVFGLVALIPLLLRAGVEVFRTSKLHMHGLRGVLNAVAMLTFFLGLSTTPLATVAALSFTTPLFVTLLAFLVLKEAVGMRRILGVLVGFAGALIILRPGLEVVSFGAALILISSCAWAAALIDIKLLSRTESGLTITLYAALFLIPITGAAALPFWSWPSMLHWSLLLVVGALGSITQMSIVQAFRLADTTQVMPVDFAKLIWAVVLGWLMFREMPDGWTLIGGCVIFSSVVYVALREARAKAQAKAKAAEAA